MGTHPPTPLDDTAGTLLASCVTMVALVGASLGFPGFFTRDLSVAPGLPPPPRPLPPSIAHLAGQGLCHKSVYVYCWTSICLNAFTAFLAATFCSLLLSHDLQPNSSFPLVRHASVF